MFRFSVIRLTICKLEPQLTIDGGVSSIPVKSGVLKPKDCMICAHAHDNEVEAGTSLNSKRLMSGPCDHRIEYGQDVWWGHCFPSWRIDHLG